MPECQVKLRRPHAKQREIFKHPASRKIIRAGRRGGKTTLAATIAVKSFLRGRRVLYGTPTADQIDRFWFETRRAFAVPLNERRLYKHDGLHILGFPTIGAHVEQSNGDVVSGEETRIRAKTMWNADMARGDYGDLIILDEFQMMNEEVWDRVCAPMLLDNNGDVIFIYTPPSLSTRSKSRAQDPLAAAKRFKDYARRMAEGDPRYGAFHFTSHDNPHLSREALGEISQDMTDIAYRQEIMAEDLEDNPRALWKRQWIEDGRAIQHRGLARMAVAVDPTGTKDGDECGIIGGGSTGSAADDQVFVLEDASIHGSPEEWAKAAVTLYHKLEADVLVAESNFGGEMVEFTIRTVDPTVNVQLIHASRGKQIRAEPVASIYQQGRGHHVGKFPKLEDEFCLWEPGMKSPNRLDAAVWLASYLVLGAKPKKKVRPLRRVA